MDVHFKNETVQAVWEKLVVRNPEQSEFLQAAEEVLATIEPVFEHRPDLLPVLSSLVEPERQIIFRWRTARAKLTAATPLTSLAGINDRNSSHIAKNIGSDQVPWMDDAGNTLVNRGFRVQFNSAIGPYKGGLRFHPSVNLSILKFLGFEQIFKNSLTTLAMGGGKGGSDFDPKGKSDAEVMRFCQSFMTELARHIGGHTDIPAGDIGVGSREIGYLFGQYKRLTAHFEGVLTGKGLPFSGSLLRPEATGYGLVYFSQEMLRGKDETLQGKRVAVSGSGNVSMFCVEKLLDLGAVPVSLSDSAGTLYVPGGISKQLMAQLYDMKIHKRKRLSECTELAVGLQYAPGQRPWQVVKDVRVAMPCATQNELELEDAKALIQAGVKYVAEGANMPSTPTAIKALHDAGVLFGPAKAANAGGVAVSGLEMAQNSTRLSWTQEEVDARLQAIMKGIYNSCMDAARQYNTTLQAGANIAGFIKVAEAMLAQGCV